MQAKKSLSNISKNKELWIAQWKQESFDRDIRSGLNAALNKGIAQGIQQGILQERISVIRAMLASGKIPVQEIASILQIPVEEVQKLI